MFKANRAHDRYPLFARAKIVKINKIDSGAIKTEVSCISKAGLGVYSAEPIGIGSEISINIGFFNYAGKRVDDTIEGKVVWASKHDNIYHMGIFFNEELDPEKQPNLHRHLEDVIKASDKAHRK